MPRRPSQTYSGPGQPYGPPPGSYNEPYYGQQGRYDGPGGPPRPYRDEDRDRDDTYSSNEIVAAGHRFFGTVTQGLARVIEYAFQQQGRPNGYILGQDAGGAFVAGLRYGEGTLYTKDAGTHRVYWQGPSIGWDAGGDGSKVMVLVYNLRDPADIYRRFGGVDGSAYIVGGVGLTFQKNGDLVTAPIRTGAWPAPGCQRRLFEVYACADLESVLGWQPTNRQRCRVTRGSVVALVSARSRRPCAGSAKRLCATTALLVRPVLKPRMRC